MATIAWSRDFDNSPRHCFEGNDGHRWLNGDIDTECRKAHTPRLIGLTEWLRFIREFGAQVSEDQNPFTSEGGFRLLNDYSHPTSDGRLAYAETYLREKPDSWGLSPVFRVFLDNKAGWARIECYDEELVGACDLALLAVERSYSD